MVHLGVLAVDLPAEHEALDDCLAPLSALDWVRETPAVGWSIQDQIAHLAFSDDAATLSVTDAAGFRAQLAALDNDPRQVNGLQLRTGRTLTSEHVFA
jgi:hypothetical protein